MGVCGKAWEVKITSYWLKGFREARESWVLIQVVSLRSKGPREASPPPAESSMQKLY